ncbi:hypothetical protein Bca101_084227 [Brassica carinata]
MSAKELAWSLPFLLFVTAPLGFEDYPYDGATGFKASLPSCCSSCFEESPVSPPVLHFSTLHRRNLGSVLHVGGVLASPFGVLLSRKLRVWFCSTSSSSGVPEPLPAASVEAVRSHPRVSVRVSLP